MESGTGAPVDARAIPERVVKVLLQPVLPRPLEQSGPVQGSRRATCNLTDITEVEDPPEAAVVVSKMEAEVEELVFRRQHQARYRLELRWSRSVPQIVYRDPIRDFGPRDVAVQLHHGPRLRRAVGSRMVVCAVPGRWGERMICGVSQSAQDFVGAIQLALAEPASRGLPSAATRRLDRCGGPARRP